MGRNVWVQALAVLLLISSVSASPGLAGSTKKRRLSYCTVLMSTLMCVLAPWVEASTPCAPLPTVARADLGACSYRSLQTQAPMRLWGPDPQLAAASSDAPDLIVGLPDPDSHDSDEHEGDAADSAQVGCEREVGKKIWYQGRCRDFDIIRHAPRLYLHSGEIFYPSSVDAFMSHVIERDGHLVSKDDLGEPESYKLPFLRGEKPNRTSAPPVYALIVPKQAGMIDVVYWMFYPYNRGKEVCIGYRSSLGCMGRTKTFGNHVGDWEHITIRYIDLMPAYLYLSAHSFGGAFRWKDPAITYLDDHPVVFAAAGSHGVYAQAGSFTYRSLVNGDSLTDHTDEGTAWDTWKHLQALIFRKGESLPPHFAWLAYRGAWGNPKQGCGVYEYVSGECVLNSGPSGPALKGATLLDDLD